MSGKFLRQGALMVLAFTAQGAGNNFAECAATFKAHCSKCHPRASTLARNLKGGTRGERTAFLSELLESHHGVDPIDRAAIIEYLVGQTAP